MKRVIPAVSRQRLRVPLGAVLIGMAAAASVTVASGTPDREQASASVAVIGDQYAAGSRDRVVWPVLLAERTGWKVSNFALPGAGFVADDTGDSFNYQMDRAEAAHPDVLLIVGGINDTSVPDPAPIEIGALDAMHKAILRGQRVLVIGPAWYAQPAPKALVTVSDAVASAAQIADVPFVSALDPPWLTREQMLPDLSGPTDDGQSVIADKIAGCVRSAFGI